MWSCSDDLCACLHLCACLQIDSRDGETISLAIASGWSLRGLFSSWVCACTHLGVVQCLGRILMEKDVNARLEKK